jgi:amidophosphoribosyltransferase
MCGIIGIQTQSTPVFPELYDGLLMLQHRGQDAAGIVTFDQKKFHEKKEEGLVKDVFKQNDALNLTGNMGLGHVRYPTAGTLSVKEAQPFFVNAPFGIFLVHNGNLTNTQFLRKKLQNKYRRHLRTESDSEILLNVFSDQIYNTFKNNESISNEDAVFEGAKKTINKIKGAYSVLTVIDKVGLFGFRDPFAIRPLVLGKRTTSKGDEYALASEDVAFIPLGFEKIRDIKPGEAVLITPAGQLIERQLVKGQLSPCIFEYVYLARPDSMLDNISVYKTQLRLGQKLAKQIKESNLEIDSIIPVPDSARPVALELSKETGIKYREGLVKNRYVGRTFIMPGQELREKSVKRKLNTIPLEFKNRNILLVDDSIVRGTTMRKIIEMCRKAGANKVYVASAAPPVRYSNVYGIDMPTKKELLAAGLTIPEIEKAIGADKLFYQKLEDLIDAAHQGNKEITIFEDSCFSGNYITNDITPEYLEELENQTPRSNKNTNPKLINI